MRLRVPGFFDGFGAFGSGCFGLLTVRVGPESASLVSSAMAYSPGLDVDAILESSRVVIICEGGGDGESHGGSTMGNRRKAMMGIDNKQAMRE